VARLDDLLRGTPYVSYAYAYPHKTAYRALDPARPLRDLWADERRDALFLYLHIPFCAARCGYCNLFTTAQPPPALTAAYVRALRHQAEQVRAALGDATVARMAVGGGTPTFLGPDALDGLFDLAEDVFGLDPQRVPISVEVSPGTATAQRLRRLRARGVTRISVGVQSFDDAEVAAAGRSQTAAQVATVLGRVRDLGFPTLNLDLIYGLPGQTVASWRRSLRTALRFGPEELYLYPLYVRPLTGLARRRQGWDDYLESASCADDVRPACYRAGRALLLAAGYEQVSMRLFRRGESAAEDAPTYRCQEDGMVGLGCGARSYTRAVHYSSEYGVSRGSVGAILADYVNRPAEAFALAHHGVLLDAEEQHRRYVIKSLLRTAGLDLAAFRAYFGRGALEALPELGELLPRGLAVRTDRRLRLTAEGLAHTDVLGPWLYSARTRRLMRDYHFQ
jgi:oxygen-independent coproporphyrinogen-3 oxidase